MIASTTRSAPPLLLLVVLALVAGIPAGCAGPARLESPPVPAMLWPDPPEIPRISLVSMVSAPTDLGIREAGLRAVWRRLSGRVSPALVNPHGLAAGAGGRLYVVDHALRRVHLFDPQRNLHRLFPAEEPALASPIGTVLDEPGGRLFVSDSAAGVVWVFDADGSTVLAELRSGGMGRPTGLQVNPVTGELLVVDTENAAILRFDLASLEFTGVIGREGAAAGHFHAPTHIAVAPDGRIVVSDSLNFRIQVLDARGAFLFSFGGPGDSPGHFARPKGVAVDSDGNIYVVDALFDNVQVFSRAGELLLAFGSPGHGPGEFWLPSGIAIDHQDRIYVSDSYNHRVQVFQYLRDGEWH